MERLGHKWTIVISSVDISFHKFCDADVCLGVSGSTVLSSNLNRHKRSLCRWHSLTVSWGSGPSSNHPRNHMYSVIYIFYACLYRDKSDSVVWKKSWHQGRLGTASVWANHHIIAQQNSPKYALSTLQLHLDRLERSLAKSITLCNPTDSYLPQNNEKASKMRGFISSVFTPRLVICSASAFPKQPIRPNIKPTVAAPSPAHQRKPVGSQFCGMKSTALVLGRQIKKLRQKTCGKWKQVHG